MLSTMFSTIFKFVDNWLDRITMYRLALYYLIGLLGAALVLSVAKVLPYNPAALIFSVVFLIAVCWWTNIIFSRTFKVPTNVESVYISALILALIITPAASVHDLVFLGWAGVWAMASKYILAIRGKHVFNPVGLAVALTAVTINQSATWWVGTLPLLPLVAIGGFLIVRKIRRWGLVATFLLAALATSLIFTWWNGADLLRTLQQTFVLSPLIFFGAIILTEPLTTPPTRPLQIAYGAIVGILFSPQFHIGGLYLTPELAILAGNVFSYLVSPKAKLMLTLKQKIQVAPDIYDFIFAPNRKLSFVPGQYMEWTLGHEHPDSRGNRRYFTLANSPTENELRVGVKFYKNSSSYKKAMLSMDRETEIVAAQLAGDFTLPRNRNQKLVFIAGGIGITPFRSMIKYLLDNNQRRNIVMFYANKTVRDIVYKDVFDKAAARLGIKTVYTLTDKSQVPPDWWGKVGYINGSMIRQEVPDYKHSIFYLSGPPAMVQSFNEVLLGMGVHRDHIKMDFFPGLV